MPYDLSALQRYLRNVYFKKRVRQSRTKATLSRSLLLSAKTEMVHIVQNKVYGFNGFFISRYFKMIYAMNKNRKKTI